MVSEIEKMYIKAGVKYGSCGYYDRLEKCCNSPYCESGECPHGIGGEINPFTADKQIKLINLLGMQYGQMHIIRGIDNGFRIEFSTYRQGYQLTLAEAIANFINEKWDYISDKTKIKNILSNMPDLNIAKIIVNN